MSTCHFWHCSLYHVTMYRSRRVIMQDFGTCLGRIRLGQTQPGQVGWMICSTMIACGHVVTFHGVLILLYGTFRVIFVSSVVASNI